MINYDSENNEEEVDKVEIPEWLTIALEKNRRNKKPEDSVIAPITKEQAIEIANLDENLKSDFCRHSFRSGISFMVFTKEKAKLVKRNNRTYWMIQILNGDISQIEDNGLGGEIFSDGCFSDKELKKLRCLIDVETGEYIYYPRRGLFNHEEDDEYEDTDMDY